MYTTALAALLGTPPFYAVTVDGELDGGFVAEPFHRDGAPTRVAVLPDEKIEVRDNQRLFATGSLGESSIESIDDWTPISYRQFSLVNRDLSFDVDLSGVPCGCNGAIYLVGMSSPNQWNSNYCDIQMSGDQRCLEVYLLEGNAKAVQSTLHTAEGKGNEGHSCNQDGCYASLGKDRSTAHLYGPGASEGIDTSRPFTVSATFREAHDENGAPGVAYDVTLMQSDSVSGSGSSRSVHFFDSEAVAGSHSADGSPQPVPAADRTRTRDALLNKMVLVVSLWTADDLSWLDGGCKDWIAAGRSTCDLPNARLVLSKCARRASHRLHRRHHRRRHRHRLRRLHHHRRHGRRLGCR